MNTIGLRHQCLVEAKESLDNALAAMARARHHLSLDYRSEARQLHAQRNMLNQFRKLIAEKSLAVRQEIDGK